MSSTSAVSSHTHNTFCAIVPPHLQSGAMKAKIAKAKEASRIRGLLPAIERGLKIPKKNDSIVKIFDANFKDVLPGRKISDPKAHGNSSEERAYNGAKLTYEVYRDIFNRNSLDNKGMPLLNTVHFEKNYENAYFDGTQMVYGEGDGETFGDFTLDIDIMAHELTHGVTQYTSNLTYEGESGALNEHMSDAFASIVKQYHRQETVDKANWLIGENVLLGDGYALRSMKKPGTGYVDHPTLGTDPQPDSWAKVVDPKTDDPHINSGIANRAFYIACTEVGGHSWERIGQIWYELQSKLVPEETFHGFATKSIEVAKKKFPGSSSHGDLSPEAKAVINGWRAVDVL